MKVKTGDIFLIPIDGENNAIGQIVVEEKNFIYVAVYTKNDNLLYNMDDHLLEGLPLVLARTSKLFFKLGRWKIISNKVVKRDISYFPNYKIETLDGVFVTNFNRQVLRKASSQDEAFYGFYNTVSPAMLVSAIKAVLGIIAMDDDYRKLTYEFVKSRSNEGN